MIILDITNLCNLRCIHCPQPQIQAAKGYKPIFMEMAHFAKILEDIRSVGEKTLVRITGDGEPLLHPEIISMLRLAAEIPNVVVNLTTNGMSMRPKMADALLESGVHLVDFSLDAHTKPVYEKVRLGGSFERVMRNIFYFLEKNGKGNKPVKTMVSFINQKDNTHETEAFKAFWNPLVDYVMVRQLHSAAGRVKVKESSERNLADQVNRYPCPHLWKRLTVDFSGNIKFCAHDWGDETVLGQMDSVSLREVWGGQALAKIRRQHLANDYNVHHLCAPCSDWASSKWDYGYEKLVDRLVFKVPTLFNH